MSEIPINKKIVLQTPQGEYVQPYIETDSILSTESSNPIQNQAVTTELNNCLRYDVQGSTDPTEPVSLYHSQLENLDYDSSGHTGFLKDDASNLTTEGQKVFDGRWVKSSHTLISGGTLPTSAPERVEINLSEYLPKDVYFYDVTLNGVVYVGTSDARCTLSVYGKDNDISHYICRASKAKDSNAGNCVVSIETSRIVVVDYWNTNNGTFDLKMQGYRRIGTNQ